MNFDFILLRNDHLDKIHTSSLIRRFLAAYVDTLIVLLSIIFIGMSTSESDLAYVQTFKNYFNSIVVFSVTYLPELLYRQTFGMLLFDLVVIVPPNQNPIKALFKRRFINFIEFGLPSFIYFFCVAFNKDNKSISDQFSHCIIARKKHLLQGITKSENHLFLKVLIPVFFSLLPILIPISIWLFFFLLLENLTLTSFILEAIDFFNSII